MEELQCVIVEDDPVACIILEQLVLTRTNFKLAGVFEDAGLAYEFLNSRKFEGLLFLDVELKNGSGIEMVKKLQSTPGIIFTTSHENFAFTAYELGAIDFLRKPITSIRFDIAVERYKLNNGLKALSKKENPEECLFFKTGKDLVKLKTSDIFFFEAAKDYVKIHAASGPQLILSTMKGLEAKLNKENFLRISKSVIVNITLVNRVSGKMVYINKTGQKISRSYSSQVKKKLSHI